MRRVDRLINRIAHHCSSSGAVRSRGLNSCHCRHRWLAGGLPLSTLMPCTDNKRLGWQRFFLPAGVFSRRTRSVRTANMSSHEIRFFCLPVPAFPVVLHRLLRHYRRPLGAKMSYYGQLVIGEMSIAQTAFSLPRSSCLDRNSSAPCSRTTGAWPSAFTPGIHPVGSHSALHKA